MINRLGETISGVLQQIGLQNFRLEVYELAGEPKIVASIWRELYFDIKAFESDTLAKILHDKIKPITDDIENSPHIASLKARHADEVSALHDQIKTLQEQNMKLSGTIEYLDGKLAAKKATDEQE